MRLGLNLSGYEDATRRLALAAGQRADELVRSRGGRRIAPVETHDWPLGAEAWPGLRKGIQIPREPRR